MSVGPCVLHGWGMCGAHAALARGDEAGSLDDARARDLLFDLGGVGLSLHNVLSESPACSRGLRWPRRDVSGYWQKRCLFAHWLIKKFGQDLFDFANQSFQFSRIMVRRRTQRGDGETVVKGLTEG